MRIQYTVLKRKIFSLSLNMSSDVSGERSATGRLFHTVDQETPVAVACLRSWNLQLLQVGGPD